jgi:hypothetical protein
MLPRVLALIVLLSVGCATAPPPHAAGPAGREYFPMQIGTRWVYELRTGFFTRTRLEVTAQGERAVRDSDEGIFVMEEQLSGRVYGLEPTGLVGYQVADGYLTRIAAVQPLPDGRVHIFGGDGTSFLPVEPQPGQKWTDHSEVFRHSEMAGLNWTAEIESVGRLHVPAGTFDDVIVVRTAQWDPEWNATEPLNTYDDYYARGVGLIRSVSTNHAQRFWSPSSVEQVLLSVSFADAAPAAVRE